VAVASEQSGAGLSDLSREEIPTEEDIVIDSNPTKVGG
jgi:hypothetical protein